MSAPECVSASNHARCNINTASLPFTAVSVVRYIIAAVLAVVTVAKTHQLGALQFWAKKSNDAIVKESLRLKESLVVLHDRYNMLLRRIQDHDD